MLTEPDKALPTTAIGSPAILVLNLRVFFRPLYSSKDRVGLRSLEYCLSLLFMLGESGPLPWHIIQHLIPIPGRALIPPQRRDRADMSDLRSLRSSPRGGWRGGA